MSIEFGWQHFIFELRDVEIVTSISIEEKDEDGEWTDRDRPLITDPDDRHEIEAITKQFEDNQDIRIGTPERRLSATASPIGNWSETRIFIGIPEDKESFYDLGEWKTINSLYVNFHETDYLSGPRHKGHISHYKASRPDFESTEETTNLTLVLPPVFFDSIEKALDKGGQNLSIEVQIKCWHHLGHAGESSLFINENGFSRKTGDGLAEITSFWAKKGLPAPDEPDELDEPLPIAPAEVRYVGQISQQIFELNGILTQIRSISLGVLTVVLTLVVASIWVTIG